MEIVLNRLDLPGDSFLYRFTGANSSGRSLDLQTLSCQYNGLRDQLTLFRLSEIDLQIPGLFRSMSLLYEIFDCVECMNLRIIPIS